jgi:hypothetical protein
MNGSLHKKDQSGFKFYGYIGLLIVIIAEIFLFLRVYWVGLFFTPIAWSGYILFIDSFIFKLKGSSLISNRTNEFLVMLPLSVCLWLVFEFYNIFLKNWHYVNLPDQVWIRMIGYTWSFATIWPAILETKELVMTLRIFDKMPFKPLRISRRLLYCSIALGAAFLTIPIIFPSQYLAVLVWTGFIFLLDPINYLNQEKSILKDLESGSPGTFLSLFLSGLWCGILWEFWNFWTIGRWTYTVPILGQVKLFEMPVVGYFGFLVFAVEVYVLYNFAQLVARTLQRS